MKKYIPTSIKKILIRIYFKRKYRNLKLFPGSNIGKDCVFEEGVTIYSKVNLFNSSVGKYTYIASNSSFSSTRIGRFCSIGPEIMCGLGMHPTQKIVSTHPSFFSTRGQSQVIFSDGTHFNETSAINIGNDVWIGARVIIMDGVTIGDGAIIGAGSIVNRDIPAYAIAVGVPAKVKKYRFTDKQISQLNHIKWWDWDLDRIKKHSNLFLDIDDFLSSITQN